MLRTNHKRFSCVVFIIIFFCTVSKTLAEEAENRNLPEYECRQVHGKILIDGNFDEPAWQKAELIDKFYVPERFDIARSKTEARLLFDEKYLYVAVKTYDKDIFAWGERDNIGGGMFRADVVELFIQPSQEPPYYYEIVFNPAGVVYDAYMAYELAGDLRFAKWNGEIDSAVVVKGTLDDWADEDEYYQVEFRIKFSSLPSLKGQFPKAGDIWSFHVARYDYSVYLKGFELSSCALLTKSNFHQLERFCFLKFVK